MLLTIDVGNSSTGFGLFKGMKLARKWRVLTSKLKENLSAKAEAVIVASVVPTADRLIRRKYPKAWFIVGSEVKGIRVKLKDKQKIGADRIVNAYAAVQLYKKPAIVVDFGTATTFDIISNKAEYLGGAIVPGIRMSADSLHERTAKLPKIKIEPPKNIIGNSTIAAMRAGIVYGYASLVEGMIVRYKKAMKGKPIVIATGGYARLIMKYARGIDIIDEDLTLKGLNLLWLKN
jgi:type III pantothenate kinase